jgi:hypothetical protein
MKSVRSSSPTANGSTPSRRTAARLSIVRLKSVARLILLVALAGGSLAAVAYRHVWFTGRTSSDSAMQAAKAPASDLLPETSSPGKFVTFNVHGAGTTAMEGTFATAINAGGEVTGMYSNAQGVVHGFVRDARGVIATFDAPDSGKSFFEGTIPLSINTAGEITGTVIDSNHLSHGFVRNVGGKLTVFDPPAVGKAKTLGTTAGRINDAGDVVGFFLTGAGSAPTTYHGFLRKADGTFTIIDDPKAGTAQNPQNGRKEGTQAFAINNAGEIVGSYIDSKSNRFGFIRYPNGRFAEFGPSGPGAGTLGAHGGMTGTIPTGIDAAGVVAGTYTDAKGLFNGFLRETDGAFRTFDAQGATAGTGLLKGTIPLNVNLSTGAVVGFFADSSGVFHGFERSAAGAVTVINPPGMGSNAASFLAGAGAGGVNEFGDVAGGYSDASGVLHGFIFTPTPQVGTPTFLSTPRKGPFTGPITVEIEDAIAGAAVYYTLDKSVPSPLTSKKYSAPITISKTTTIKAIAVKSGYVNSGVATATYTIVNAQAKSWSPITDIAKRVPR